MLKRLFIAALLSISLILPFSSSEGIVPYIYSPLPQVDFTPVPVVRSYEPKQILIPSPLPKTKKIDKIEPSTVILGVATWYCESGVSRCMWKYPDTSAVDMYAAASHQLQQFLGRNWRNMVVTVIANSGAKIKVRLIDSCACGGDHRIDLYHDAFVLLLNLSEGNLNPVRIIRD